MQNLTKDQELRADSLMTFISEKFSPIAISTLIEEYGSDLFFQLAEKMKKEADFKNCVDSMKNFHPAL
ncbi:MAG: hypothetical protein GY739_16570 [Mesoflavibacter sp.]|nr:hypothetical protein [Mesoflavibacter sp.]